MHALDLCSVRNFCASNFQRAWYRGGHVYCLSPTQLATPARAFAKPLGSVPPACAISARPPPLPPTCCATKLTSSPAFTFEVASAVTPAIKLTLPSATPAHTIAAGFRLFFP